MDKNIKIVFHIGDDQLLLLGPGMRAWAREPFDCRLAVRVSGVRVSSSYYYFEHLLIYANKYIF